MQKRKVRSIIRWGVIWNGRLMWDWPRHLLFNTQREARVYILEKYGYIKTRKDLRSPPFNWRMAKPSVFPSPPVRHPAGRKQRKEKR